MELVQVAADVVPKPVAVTVKYDAILLAIVVVGLLAAPRWPLHHIAGHPAPGAGGERRLFLGADPHHLRLNEKTVISDIYLSWFGRESASASIMLFKTWYLNPAVKLLNACNEQSRSFSERRVGNERLESVA